MGPFFGKDENHIVVVGRAGFSETTDAGKTWKTILPLKGLESQLDPGNMIGGRSCKITWFDGFAWDPVGNVFYHSRMYDPARKCQR